MPLEYQVQRENMKKRRKSKSKKQKVVKTSLRTCKSSELWKLVGSPPQDQKVVYAEIESIDDMGNHILWFSPMYKGKRIQKYWGDSLIKYYLASEGFIPVTDKFFWKKA